MSCQSKSLNPLFIRSFYQTIPECQGRQISQVLIPYSSGHFIKLVRGSAQHDMF